MRDAARDQRTQKAQKITAMNILLIVDGISTVNTCIVNAKFWKALDERLKIEDRRRKMADCDPEIRSQDCNFFDPVLESISNTDCVTMHDCTRFWSSKEYTSFPTSGLNLQYSAHPIFGAGNDAAYV